MVFWLIADITLLVFAVLSVVVILTWAAVSARRAEHAARMQSDFSERRRCHDENPRHRAARHAQRGRDP